jgi:hypothetical protein
MVHEDDTVIWEMNEGTLEEISKGSYNVKILN